jgi:hypothetical protein
MPITLPPALVRTNYFTWPPGSGGMYDPNADPDNPSADPAEATPVAGLPSNGTMATDEEQYFRPLERIHGMGLHAPGVAFGMELLCTIGDTSVQITPGIGLDPIGKHILLASGGNAALGPGSDYPGPAPVTAPVSASGVTLPVSGLTGDQYVVAQWWETWDSASYYATGVNQFDDTPWLQFVDSSEYDPDVHIVLGKVNLNTSGQISAVSYGDVGGIQRTSVGLPAQTLQLQRATVTGSTNVSSSAWGEVRAREGGGIEVVTQNAGDQVNVVTTGGGNFSSMAVAANQATFGVTSNPGITLNGAEATVRVGAPGNYGDVLVYDGNNHLSVTLIGDTGHVIVGGPTLNGEVRMLDSNANQTMTLDGSSGSAIVQNLTAFSNDTINVNTTFFRCHGTDFCLDGRSHNNNRALVDDNELLVINYNGDYQNGVEINGAGLQVDGNITAGGNVTVNGTLFDGNGTPLEGNPARKADFQILFAGASDFSGFANSSTTADVTFGSPTQCSAFAALAFVEIYVSLSYHGGAATGIFQIDGNPAWNYVSSTYMGNIWAPQFIGTATTVTFIAQAGYDSMATAANCWVFFE